MSIKIYKRQKMLEICEFLGVKENSLFKYQNRGKKTPTFTINKLGFRLLMNADLRTLEFFLNDRNFTDDYFIPDNPDLMKLNTIKYDDREIIKKHHTELHKLK